MRTLKLPPTTSWVHSLCVGRGSVRVFVCTTCEQNLLETSCIVALVSWLPAQHTKHLNALRPIDLACPPLADSVCLWCVCVSVFLCIWHEHTWICLLSTGRGSKLVSQSASTTDSQQLESPAATSLTSCNNSSNKKEIPILICVESK